MADGSREVILETGIQEVILIPSFISEKCFEALRDQLNWQQNSLSFFGKSYLEPRLTAWYGLPYTYSSVMWPEQPMTDLLNHLNQQVSQAAGSSFNSVLANYYRHGTDSMGWHRDNEPEMDQSVIASLSFGGERKFSIRKRKEKKRIDIMLTSGSLLLMKNMQSDWEHSIPKTRKCTQPRINLTFRRIKTLR